MTRLATALGFLALCAASTASAQSYPYWDPFSRFNSQMPEVRRPVPDGSRYGLGSTGVPLMPYTPTPRVDPDRTHRFDYSFEPRPAQNYYHFNRRPY